MNKNKIANRSTLFLNKLDKILEQLHKDRDTIPIQTKEAIVGEASRLLSLFYQSVDKQGFTFKKVTSGTLPDIDLYNKTFQEISDDLAILFLELENLETVVIENFNLFTTQANRLNSRVKKLAGQVLDYSLYSKLPIKNSIFLSDSFNDSSKIETASLFLNSSECELDQTQGIVTLPISEKTILSINSVPVINSNSTGRAGNNEELFVNNRNADIKVVLDNNPDTWFEYEKVVLEEDEDPLLLDFTINLLQEEIVNYIRLNPNNFGTKTEIEILDIQTSDDGNIYKSIKDEVSLGSIGLVDEPNKFVLAPSTSKFSGQGVFSFTPRFAKYIKISLRQGTAYPIQTVSGTQLRYAIGIRDVEISKVKYLQQGELVGATFATASPIKKVALYSKQNLSTNDLGKIEHQISFDEGSSWHGLSPLEKDGLINIASVDKEVLNVNTDEIDSVKTQTEALSIKWKTKLTRNDDAFKEGSIAFAEKISNKTELKTVPLSEPWSFKLDEPALKETIGLVDLNFGSRGSDRTGYLVGNGTGSSVHFIIPFEDLRLDLIKNGSDIFLTDASEIYVSGKKWTRVNSLEGQSSTAEVYCLSLPQQKSDSFVISKFIKKDKLIKTSSNIRSSLNTLSFGNGINGKAPPAGAVIEIRFTDELLFFNNNKTAELEFPVGADKSTVTIYKKGLIAKDIDSLISGTQIHKLQNINVIDTDSRSITFSNAGSVFSNQVDFINGQRAPAGELISPGDWSLDATRGVIYSYSSTGTDPGFISYFYQNESVLNNSQWDWGDTDNVHHSIKINENAWAPESEPGLDFDSETNKLLLDNFSIIPGTIKITGIEDLASSENPFLIEVEFIDGNAELQTAIKTREAIPVLLPVGMIASFTTLTRINSDSTLPISFDDDTTFTTEVNSLDLVDGLGDYFINRSTSTIHVFTNGATINAVGDIVYYTSDPSKRKKGKYSIDYKKGIIYTERLVPAVDIQISYQYSEYYIKYNIARKVDSDNIIFNPSTNTITVKPAEIQLKKRLPFLSGNNSSNSDSYQINYQHVAKVRKNIELLKEYFTPILKEYALQIIPSNLL